MNHFIEFRNKVLKVKKLRPIMLKYVRDNRELVTSSKWKFKIARGYLADISNEELAGLAISISIKKSA